MGWNRIIALIAIAFTPILFNGCKVSYGFTGGSIPEDVKTIQIQNIVNESGQGPATLGQNITEKLKLYYQNNSKLKLVNEDGDWQIDGKIVSYTVTPVAPQQNETAAANRLTINVAINFISQKNEKHKFTETFSFFSDFAQGQSLSQVENEKVETIFEQIVRDIFVKTTSLDW